MTADNESYDKSADSDIVIAIEALADQLADMDCSDRDEVRKTVDYVTDELRSLASDIRKVDAEAILAANAGPLVAPGES